MVKIQKEEKAIIAYTRNYKVEGKMYLPIGARLSDFISSAQQKNFIPVTGAVVTDLSGRQVCITDFLELNRDEIVFLVPKGESKKIE